MNYSNRLINKGLLRGQALVWAPSRVTKRWRISPMPPMWVTSSSSGAMVRRGSRTQFYNTFQSASAALEKLSGVLEEQPGVPEPERPTLIAKVRGDVRFEHVGFSYVDGVTVLPDLDLAVPAGQTVALVGTTGAGKTTKA